MKKLIPLLVSLALLGLIYWKLNQRGELAELGRIFRDCDPVWMTLSLGMVVPLTLFTAARLRQLMPRAGQLPFAEANRLILAASVLNLILPSKMGDLAKAWFMRKRGQVDGALAFALVVFEKSCDLLSLLLWCLFGLWFYPAKDAFFWSMIAAISGALLLGLLLLGWEKFATFSFAVLARLAPRKIARRIDGLAAGWREMHAFFWSSPTRLAKIVLSSVLIWFLHLLQIWMFIFALRASVPFLANLALAPLALLAGLLPFTFAGVGTRDLALCFLYRPYFDAPTAAALGLLCTARYLLPALGGLPFAGRYLAALKGAKASSPG